MLTVHRGKKGGGGEERKGREEEEKDKVYVRAVM